MFTSLIYWLVSRSYLYSSFFSFLLFHLFLIDNFLGLRHGSGLVLRVIPILEECGGSFTSYTRLFRHLYLFLFLGCSLLGWHILI